MFNLSLHSFIKSRKSKIATLSAVILLIGAAAQGAIQLNTKEGGYVICIAPKTNILSHPGKAKCPKGSTRLVLGAKGKQGIAGINGPAGQDGVAGENGANGKDANTLWNGKQNPDSSTGSSGDFYINTITNLLFGPKNVDGTWPNPVPLRGPRGGDGSAGANGATGATGATGPAGVGASLSRVFTDQYADAMSPGPGGETITSFSSSYFETFTQLSLPAGNWLLNLSGTVQSPSGDAGYVQCFNEFGVTESSLVAIVYLLPIGGNTSVASLSAQSVITLPEATTVGIICAVVPATTGSMDNTYMRLLTFTATEVGVVDRENTFSPPTARGRSSYTSG